MRIWQVLIATAALVVTVSLTRAQAIDFESLAPGTAVTNQFAGVTFGILGGGPVNATIGQTAAGNGQINSTSSPSQFLRGRSYFGDVPVALIMNFTSLQRRVSFNTGMLRNIPVTVTVQAFDNAGALIPSLSRTINISAADSGAINIPVSITSTIQNVRTVYVYTVRDGEGGEAPYIDDLSFCTQLDANDPVVSLTSPPDLSCVCPGSTVNFSGTLDAGLCGGYSSDRLEYRSINDTDWTVIVGPFTSLPNGGDSYTGLLYTWVVPASLPGGWYYFRARMYNDAGRSESDVVILYVDRSPPSIANTSPATNSVVRASVCLLGQVLDQCSQSYTAEYRTAGAGAYIPVSTAGVTWPYLAIWPTAALSDGNYDFRISASDGCGNASSLARVFIVDNTAPVARITSPVPCEIVGGLVQVRGEVSDTHLAGWTLQYTGGDAAGWVTIASGNTAVAAGSLLGIWDTRSLRTCGYTLRLIATDSADNNCNSGGNRGEALVSVEVNDCPADFNRSGLVSVQDIFDFLAAYFAGCP